MGNINNASIAARGVSGFEKNLEIKKLMTALQSESREKNLVLDPLVTTWFFLDVLLVLQSEADTIKIRGKQKKNWNILVRKKSD